MRNEKVKSYSKFLEIATPRRLRTLQPIDRQG
jgi:hypothetical protein